MKRPVVTAVILFAVAGLAGCPIYDHENDGCYRDSDCAQNYFCDKTTGDCRSASAYSCTKPSDCDRTSTCTPSGQCMSGDCYFNGCVAGFFCDSSTGIWQCIANGTGEAGAAGASDAAGQGGAAGQTAVVVGASGAGEGGMSVGVAGGG
jgi:hypothetical protein